MTSSNGNFFRVTGHLCGDFTGPRWIPRTKASVAKHLKMSSGNWRPFYLGLNVLSSIRIEKYFEPKVWHTFNCIGWCQIYHESHWFANSYHIYLTQIISFKMSQKLYLTHNMEGQNKQNVMIHGISKFVRGKVDGDTINQNSTIVSSSTFKSRLGLFLILLSTRFCISSLGSPFTSGLARGPLTFPGYN